MSVVIPTRNRRELLRATLVSVLQQRDVDFEVIVVDDGSAVNLAPALAEVGDPRVRVVRHERPLGVSTARNRGAAEAAGAWLAFCDDDDLWAPEKLSRQHAAAAVAGRTWSYGGAVRVDMSLRILGGVPPPEPEPLARRIASWNVMPGGSSNVIVRADAFRAAGGWDPALVNLADWDLWARLAAAGLPACVPAPVVGYRIHHGNASADTALVRREARALDGRFGARLDYGELHHYLAWVSVRSGRPGRALVHFACAAARGQVSAARALASLASQRAMRALRALDWTPPGPRSAWIAEAEAWLGPLRELVLPAGHST